MLTPGSADDDAKLGWHHHTSDLWLVASQGGLRGWVLNAYKSKFNSTDKFQGNTPYWITTNLEYWLLICTLYTNIFTEGLQHRQTKHLISAISFEDPPVAVSKVIHLYR